MIDKNILIIGAGNMGSAMAIAFLDKKIIDPHHLMISNLTVDHLQNFAKMGVQLATTSKEFAKKADMIILAVKPHIVSSVLEEIKDDITPEKLIISIAAGIKIKSIKRVIGKDKKVVRVMPNLCAQVGQSMSVWVKTDDLSDKDIQVIQTLLQTIGKETFVTDEEQINVVTAISGSGPAYVFYLVELLEKAGKELGLSQEIAALLAQQTIIGSAKFLEKSAKNVTELRASVTSKGGTTAAAFEQFEKNGLEEKFVDGIKAAYERAKELGNGGKK